MSPACVLACQGLGNELFYRVYALLGAIPIILITGQKGCTEQQTGRVPDRGLGLIYIIGIFLLTGHLDWRGRLWFGRVFVGYIQFR